MENLKIKKASLNGIDSVININRASLQENYSKDDWIFLHTCGSINVAVLGDKIVGYICCINVSFFDYEETFTHNFVKLIKILKKNNKSKDITCVFSFAVLENYRNNKIGKKLMESVINENIMYLLNVRKSNVVAQQIYTKLGFIQYEKIDENYYENPTEDSFIYYKT